MNDITEQQLEFEPFSESSEFARQWALLRKHVLLILLAAIVGGALGWYLQKRKPIQYEAATTVRFREARTAMTGAGDLSETNWQTDPVQSQAELLTTRATVEGAVDSGVLQLRPLAGASIKWLAAVDAKAVSVVDTLRLRFGAGSVTAAFHGKEVSVPYGRTAELNGLSFVVPASPPAADTARYVVMPRDEASAQLGRVKFNRRVDTDVVDFFLTGTDPEYVPRSLNALTLSLQALSRESDQSVAQQRRKFLDDSRARPTRFSSLSARR
jgi:hypothetical protein